MNGGRSFKKLRLTLGNGGRGSGILQRKAKAPVLSFHKDSITLEPEVCKCPFPSQNPCPRGRWALLRETRSVCLENRMVIIHYPRRSKLVWQKWLGRKGNDF